MNARTTLVLACTCGTSTGALQVQAVRVGYVYIPQAHADLLNKYHRDYLNPYVNFHRPCFFPVPVIDPKGKIKMSYPYENVKTPFEKLSSLPGFETYLRQGVTFACTMAGTSEKLDAIAKQMSDNEFAERMVKARSNLFQQIEIFPNSVS